MEIQAAESDAWTIAEGEHVDRPTILRYRPGLRPFIGDSRYPRRLTITWDYGDTESGLPDDAQSKRLQAFEDSLDAALDNDRLAVIAFVFTRAGSREWHYYVSDVGEVGKRINQALSDQPGLPIQLAVKDDAEWSEYSKVLAQVKDESE